MTWLALPVGELCMAAMCFALQGTLQETLLRRDVLAAAANG